MQIANRSQEEDARAYCRSIGADPDEIVRGYVDTGQGHTTWTEGPRWRWYLGVSDAGLRRPI